MKNPDIPALRLLNQSITQRDFTTPQSLVAYMGAIQAQDYPMSIWAIGLRLPQATDATIEAALDAGELVRTHVMRPTWHIVSGNDVRWMLALTGKNIKAAMASHDRNMGIDAAINTKTNDLIAKALEGGQNLTRKEIMAAIERGGIETNPSRATLFMFNAEIEAICCNGVMRGKEQTYALMDEKVPKGLILSREESLYELAKRYFTSHAPATLPDFHWWSGLSMPDARMGLESIKSDLKSFVFEEKTYFLPKNTPDTVERREIPQGGKGEQNVFLLPAFDEYCVSYKDRKAVFDPQLQSNAITSNGIFKPIIVVNGAVQGIWKRSILKNNVAIDFDFFDKNQGVEQGILTGKAEQFKAFLNF